MGTIKCTNCGAVLKTQADIPAGKKVKCPKCQTLFVVAADNETSIQEEETRKPKQPAKASANDDGDDAPRKNGADKPKKSKTGLIVGIVLGALLLCCCAPGGVVGVVFW